MMRTDRWRSTLILWTLALALWATAPFAAAQSAQSLDDWYFDPEGGAAAVKSESERIASVGLVPYVESRLSQGARGALCDPSGSEELERVRRFTTVLRTHFPVADGEAAGDFSPVVPVAERIKKVSPPADPFQVEETSQEGVFEVFRGDPEHEIRLPGDDTGDFARCLITVSKSINNAIQKTHRKVRDENIASIGRAHERWTNFLANVTNDQFPWETMINGWIIKGSLHTPPMTQLRILHPEPVALAPAEGAFTVEPALALQVLGFQRYSRKEYRPRYGLSALFALRTGEAESHGWGLLFHYKKWSAGLIVRDMEGQDDVYHAVLGVEVAALFQREKNRMAALRKSWFSELGEEVGAP